jgi:hypothetical protein
MRLRAGFLLRRQPGSHRSYCAFTFRANTKTAKIVCITTIKAVNAIKKVTSRVVLGISRGLECIDLTKPVNCYMVSKNQRMEKNAPPDALCERRRIDSLPIL